MGMKNYAAAIAVAAVTAAITTEAADAFAIYNSRTAFDAMAHITVDWGIYGPAGTVISTPENRMVGGITLHIASSQGQLLRRNEGTDFTGDFSMGDHLITEDDSLSDSFLVGFDSQTVHGFGMQIEPNLTTGHWSGGIDLYNAANILIGTVAISGDKTGAEDGSAPFFGVVSPSSSISYANIWIDQSSNSVLPPKAGDIAINTMDVLVPEASSMTLLAAGLLGLAAFGWRRRSVRRVSSFS